MQFDVPLRQPVAKILLAMAVSAFSLFLALAAASGFIVKMISSPRVTLTRGELEAASRYFPNSPDLLGLIAEAELSDPTGHQTSAEKAEIAATRAVNLSPGRYDLRLLLATAREMKGDRKGAELALREALERAPNRTDVHWKLANLLVREGKLDEATGFFSRAVSARRALISQTLALVWNLTNGQTDQLEKMEAAVGQTPKARRDLAFYLVKHGLITEGVKVFNKIDKADRLASEESGAFVTGLMTVGQLELARRVWADLVTEKSEELQPLVFNGNFESNPRNGLTQFDWGIGESKYARLSFEPQGGHSGARSLRMDFAGIDTTRLEGVIRQQVLVRPGDRYRLSCFVKTNALVTPEGPRLVVTSVDKTTQVAASEPIASGTNDWREISVEFVAPPSLATLLIEVKRIPKFSYDDPTRGTIWFDDFKLVPLEAGT